MRKNRGRKKSFVFQPRKNRLKQNVRRIKRRKSRWKRHRMNQWKWSVVDKKKSIVDPNPKMYNKGTK